MKNTYYISLPAQSINKPQAIDQETWNKIAIDIETLIHDDYLPHDFKPKGHKGAGSPLIDTNIISISPQSAEQGTDFVLKRVGAKLLTQIKTDDPSWATIVAACCLVIKKHIAEAKISNKLHLKGIATGLKYFRYALETNAPIVYPSQANNVTISFVWNQSTPPEDCAQIIEDIQSLLRGNAGDVSVRFDS